MPNKFCQVSKIMIFRGKILQHAFYDFCSAENSVCVKPSLFITGCSRALKIMENFAVAYSFHVQPTVKVSWPVAMHFWVDLFIFRLPCQGFKCFVSSNNCWKNLGGMLYCFSLSWLNIVARSCLQVRVLLIFCPSFALFFISMLFVVYFHACVTLAKQVSVLIHAALRKFSSCFWKETLQAKMI